MAIYYVNERGEKINPEEAPPLSKVFTVNTEDRGHEAFLKQLRGDLGSGDGTVRITADAQPPQPVPLTESADVPASETPKRGRPPSATSPSPLTEA